MGFSFFLGASVFVFIIVFIMLWMRNADAGMTTTDGATECNSNEVPQPDLVKELMGFPVAVPLGVYTDPMQDL